MSQPYSSVPDTLARKPAAKSDLAERVFTDICDELGCAYDNEAALIAIAALKAELASCRACRTKIDCLSRGEGTTK